MWLMGTYRARKWVVHRGRLASLRAQMGHAAGLKVRFDAGRQGYSGGFDPYQSMLRGMTVARKVPCGTGNYHVGIIQLQRRLTEDR